MDGSQLPERQWPPRTADGVFGTTQWTMVVNAGGKLTPASERALSKLCQTYWLPVYAFIRSRGNGRDEAQDLTQAFFGELLAKRSFKKADPAKGKFRTYLLGAVKFFLSNEREKQQALKRGGGAKHVRIDVAEAEAHLEGKLIENETPESVFEREWVRLLMDNAAATLRAEYVKKEKGELYDMLIPFLLGGDPDLSYPALAQAQGVSEASLRMAASRMRKRYGELLRGKVLETVDSEEDVNEEVRGLLAACR